MRAVLTGGGPGIGRAVALGPAGAGATVVVADLDEAAARATAMTAGASDAASFIAGQVRSVSGGLTMAG